MAWKTARNKHGQTIATMTTEDGYVLRADSDGGITMLCPCGSAYHGKIAHRVAGLPMLDSAKHVAKLEQASHKSFGIVSYGVLHPLGH